jgi:hypothetical protein
LAEQAPNAIYIRFDYVQNAHIACLVLGKMTFIDLGVGFSEGTMASRGMRRAFVGASSLALAALVALVGTGEVAFGSGASGSAPDAVATGAAPPDPALAVAVAKWVVNGGEDELKALAADFDGLVKAADSDDLPTISLSCSQLENDVASAQAYDPIPDPQAEHNWANALEQYSRGATDCVDGANNSDASMITQASTEITNGSKDLDQVTKRLNEIAG